MEVLFRTMHGSRLYGLAHSDSDEDYFTVVAKRGGSGPHTRKKYARQTIVDGVDNLVVDFSTWLAGCQAGVPQFLEAMFSPVAEVDRIRAFRDSYVVTPAVYNTYLRTMKSFARSDTFKGKRHALRLGLNMCQIRNSGRFNPRLHPDWVEALSIMAEGTAEQVLEHAYRLAWF